MAMQNKLSLCCSKCCRCRRRLRLRRCCGAVVVARLQLKTVEQRCCKLSNYPVNKYVGNTNERRNRSQSHRKNNSQAAGSIITLTTNPNNCTENSCISFCINNNKSISQIESNEKLPCLIERDRDRQKPQVALWWDKTIWQKHLQLHISPFTSGPPFTFAHLSVTDLSQIYLWQVE